MKTVSDNLKRRLSQAMSACVENGHRLHQDAEWLGSERPASTVSLCILAQEEFAKAFLLHLVCEGIVPWSDEVRDSLRDHKRKQLLGVIMDWLSPSEDEFFASTGKEREHSTLPPHVADSMKLYVEKVQPAGHITCPPPANDPLAKSVAQGDRDRLKQDALYVGLSSDGEVINVPTQVTRDQAEIELERTERLGELVGPLRQGTIGPSLNYRLFVEAISFLFLEKQGRPFLMLGESEFSGPAVGLTGTTWPHSMAVLIENISDQSAIVVSGHATVFLDGEAVSPSFLFDQFGVHPYATNVCTLFMSEETYARGTSARDKLELYVSLEYHGTALGCKYHARLWSTYDSDAGTFKETLTDLQESVNGRSQPQAQLEKRWSRPITGRSVQLSR